MREANGISEASRASRLERVGRAGKEGRGKRSRTKRGEQTVWGKNRGTTHRGGAGYEVGAACGVGVRDYRTHVIEPYHAQLGGVERAKCPIGVDVARDEGIRRERVE